MMNIREYFDTLRNEARTDDEWWEVCEYETTIYHCMEADPDDFTMWAIENEIDLTAMDCGETVLTWWAWDMCGD